MSTYASLALSGVQPSGSGADPMPPNRTGQRQDLERDISTPMAQSTETPKVDASLLWRALGGLIAIVVVAAIAGVVLRDPIHALAEVFVGRFGLGGLFAGVLITDASPFPLTHEPVLLLGVAMGIDWWTLALVCSTASVTAGPVGYAGGWLLRTRSGARLWFEQRAPGMLAFLRAWGATGVAIAALLPIPFAVATWTAGLTGVSFPKLLAASLLRIPKTVFYLTLITQGWALGA